MFLDLLKECTVAHLREHTYVLHVSCQLQNVTRYIFITSDVKGQTVQPVQTVDALLPGIKSVQFIEFAGHPDLGIDIPSIDYPILLDALDPLRRVAIHRINIIHEGNKKISEYNTTGHGTVLLFHKTESDFEYVPDGNLLSAIITFNTLIYPDEYKSIYSLPVYQFPSSTIPIK